MTAEVLIARHPHVRSVPNPANGQDDADEHDEVADLWIPAAACGNDDGLRRALLLRAFAGDGWNDAGFRLNVRGNVAWYGVALVIYPVLTVVALVIGAALGQISPLTGETSQSDPGVIVMCFSVNS